MTTVLTRVLTVLFSVLRAPLVVDPRPFVAEPVWRADAGAPRFPEWWR